MTTSVFTADGAWCWFQDPRAVYVNGDYRRTYAGWMTRAGQLQVGAYDHDSKNVKTVTIREEWDVDDHNCNSFLVLPDRHLMIFYARHNRPGLYSRKTTRPEEIDAWEDEVLVADTPRITYSHPFYLEEERRIYVFWRGETWKPTFATSEDGKSWSAPTVLVQDKGREAQSIRPYTKLTSDGKSSIHVAFTDGHPAAEPTNSLYYLKYHQGKIYRADGSVVGSLEDLPVQHRDSDRVYDGTLSGGRAWVWDIAVDDQNRPAIAYTRFPEKDDHRYHHARWDRGSWRDVEIAPGGGWFPQTPPSEEEREPFYSGGIAIDHADPTVVYLSRPVDGTFEIEKWVWREGHWRGSSITRESRQPNVRPVVPRGYQGPGDHVLWMHGPYTHYTDYKTQIRMVLP